MKAEEIKAAVDSGKKVHWSNKSYQVIKSKDDYLIKGPTGHAIGLTWEDGKTLNGKEEDFFLAEAAVDLTAVPQKVVDAIKDAFYSMKVRVKKAEVIRNEEPESFDVAVEYGDGKKDEFSFHVDPAGNLILSDFTFSKSMGKANDGVSVITKKLKDHFQKVSESNFKVKLFEEFVNESNYQVYHNSYTSAVDTALEYAEKQGYSYDKEETATKIGMGPRKPEDGKTNKFTISLFKNGKEQKKALQIQIYGMGNRYELNTYIG